MARGKIDPPRRHVRADLFDTNLDAAAERKRLMSLSIAGR